MNSQVVPQINSYMQFVFLVGSQELVFKLISFFSGGETAKNHSLLKLFPERASLISYLQLCCVLRNPRMVCGVSWVCCLVLLCPGDAQGYIKLLVSKHCSSCAPALRPAMLLDCKIINVISCDYCKVLCCSGGAGVCGFPGEAVQAWLLGQERGLCFPDQCFLLKIHQWIFFTTAKINAADNPGPGMSSSSGYWVSAWRSANCDCY